jgi:hypothetical protein
MRADRSALFWTRIEYCAHALLHPSGISGVVAEPERSPL